MPDPMPQPKRNMKQSSPNASVVSAHLAKWVVYSCVVGVIALVVLIALYMLGVIP